MFWDLYAAAACKSDPWQHLTAAYLFLFVIRIVLWFLKRSRRDYLSFNNFHVYCTGDIKTTFVSIALSTPTILTEEKMYRLPLFSNICPYQGVKPILWTWTYNRWSTKVRLLILNEKFSKNKKDEVIEGDVRIMKIHFELLMM